MLRSRMFSIVVPLDAIRLEQFKATKEAYDSMPQVKEFIIPTRTIDAVKEYLEINDLIKDVKLIPYEHKVGFNCSKALNIGVRNAKYENIIITSPEVKPITKVLEQFSKSLDKNIICEVTDQDQNGNLTVLVTQGYRSDTPSMYFLAMFQKKDIEKINGWDEEFMKGYAYEDDDFGARWVRAGLPFEVRTDIMATHQYHPRSETIPNGLNINARHYHENDENRVIQPAHGLKNIRK